jgi:two-component system response regulator HydG
MERILVIDDDRDMCLVLSKFLAKNNFETHVAHTGKSGLKLLQANDYDLALCDYKLPDITGTTLIQKMKSINPGLAVIIISGYAEVHHAVEAFRLGASDYMIKPFYHEDLLSTISDAIITNRNRMVEEGEGEDNNETASASKEDYQFVLGKSMQAQIIQHHINLIAPCDLSVVISGETGTGKEFVAQAIHKLSRRSRKPLVAIDCGALPGELAGSELFGHVKGSFTGALADKQGSFEAADKGTIFLDEVGNLSYENQARLLRVLQERKIKRIGSTFDIPVDVRIIAATNENLIQNVKDGKFREDLFHRLNEFKIQISPLRDRREDILFFADLFLRQAAEALGREVMTLTPESRNCLLNYSWQGNLRELNNVVRRAVLLTTGSQVEPDSLPEEIRQVKIQNPVSESVNSSVGFLKSVAHATEKQTIIEALVKVNYNKSKASQLLNIDRKTLYNKLRLYNIPG